MTVEVLSGLDETPAAARLTAVGLNELPCARERDPEGRGR